MTSQPEDSLAQFVADGAEPAWPESPDPKTEALRSVQRIAAAFRASTHSEPSPQQAVLFRWRHLDVLEKIGAGSFGEVYRAYDRALRREVALKLAKRGPQGVAELSASEARRMARLRHPSILAVHGVDTDDGRLGIWADLLDGNSLEEAMAGQGAMPPSRVLSTALPLAEALSVMHSSGVVHGDIKASNIQLQDDGSPVIMDFGAGSSGDEPGVRAGSPLTMAPEQFAGDDATSASDVYAFGALLYRMLSGRHPIDGDSYEELRAAHGRRDPSRVALLPRDWRDLVDRCLSREPSQRPTSPDVVKALRVVEAAPEVRRKRRMTAALVSVLVFALCGTSYGLIKARVAEREAIAQKQDTQATFEFLASMLRAPRKNSADVRVREVLDVAAGQLDRNTVNTRQEALLRWVIGRSFLALSMPDRAREQFNLAAAIASDPATALSIRISQMTLARDSGNLEDAEAIYDSLDELFAKLPPELAHERLQKPIFRAQSLMSEDREAEAAQLLVEVVEGDLTLPADHVANVEVWRLQGIVAANRGDFLEAEKHFQKAVEWTKQYPDQLTPRISFGLEHDLATMQCRQANAVACRDTIEALLDRASALGYDSDESEIIFTNTLTQALVLLGEFDEAFDKTVELRQKALAMPGNNSRLVLTLTGNLGYQAYMSGDYPGAESWGREASRMAAELLGPDSLQTLMFDLNVAEAVVWQGRVEEGLELATAGYRQALKELGEQHIFSITAMELVALASARHGQPDEALILLEQSLAIRRATNGASDPGVWDNKSIRAEALFAAGLVSDARDLAEEVVTYRLKNDAPNSVKRLHANRLLQRIRASAADGSL